MAIEIVDFPIQNGGSFHSELLNYQRVHPLFEILNPGVLNGEHWIVEEDGIVPQLCDEKIWFTQGGLYMKSLGKVHKQTRRQAVVLELPSGYLALLWKIAHL